MDDHDDFEIVDDNELGVADTLVCGDEFGAISDISAELKEAQDLKKHLRSQCGESQKLLQSLKEQTRSNLSLQAQLKQELQQVQQLKTSLLREKEQFVAQKEQLSALLQSMTEVPGHVKRSAQLVADLNKFYQETSGVEEELAKLKQMRVQQQQMINECKVNIETINSSQRDCLVSLDKSKSYACKDCGTDIALKDDIESKCYQVGQGSFTEKKRGYLFQNAFNTVLGSTKTENFTTGSYQISWVSCAKCNHQMGWKYMSADNPNNNSKVGKFCLARYSLSSPEDRTQQK